MPETATKAPAQTQNDLLTMKEAGQFLKVSRSTLYRFMKAGKLESHKVGVQIRFYREDLRKCVK